MRYRSRNYSCRGEKVGQSPQLSLSASESLKRDVVRVAHGEGMSVSAWVRRLIEDELARLNGE